MKIQDLPDNQKPREKAQFYGIENLNDGELLALVIGSGTRGKSALEIGNELISSYQNLNILANETYANLMKQKGISTVISLKLAATFEITRRIVNLQNNYLREIKCARDLYESYKRIGLENNENAYIVLLNRNKKIVKEKHILGTYTNSIDLSAKEILNEIFISNAAYIVLVHNHPSGELSPSEDDLAATENIMTILKTVGVTLLDHIIVAKNSYYSLSEHGDINRKIKQKHKNVL